MCPLLRILPDMSLPKSGAKVSQFSISIPLVRDHPLLCDMASPWQKGRSCKRGNHCTKAAVNHYTLPGTPLNKSYGLISGGHRNLRVLQSSRNVGELACLVGDAIFLMVVGSSTIQLASQMLRLWWWCRPTLFCLGLGSLPVSPVAPDRRDNLSGGDVVCVMANKTQQEDTILFQVVVNKAVHKVAFAHMIQFSKVVADILVPVGPPQGMG